MQIILILIYVVKNDSQINACKSLKGIYSLG
ncbi:MAG: hypothetical protein ACJAYO_001808, partial [Thalassolituus oleivorans]